MRLVIQRVKTSNVSVNNKICGEINQGFNVLVGFTFGDDLKTILLMVSKILNLRVFEDSNHKMNLSILDVNGAVLIIPQFTLYADTNSGRRPSFTAALNPQAANDLFETFKNELAKKIKVESGIFGANMEVKIINDGPVTLILDSDQK